MLKNTLLAALPDSHNPNPALTPRPLDVQRARPSRAHARNVTRRDRAERLHRFLVPRGEDPEYFSIDNLEEFLPLLCRAHVLTEYEGEMWMIRTCCGDKAAAEYDEMYGDPKPRDKGFGRG